MGKIGVSVNCITYNQEMYIEEAIESFLMQKTNFNYEILIHDDASTDRTPEIIKNYERKYPDIIKLIIQKENQYSKGQKMLHLNASRAKGKYIAICEGDDYWLDPYKLQKQYDYMEGNSDCSMCFHAAEVVNIAKERINLMTAYNRDCVSSTADIIGGGGGFMATNSIMYRNGVIDNVPKFYVDSPIEDYPLQILTSTKNYAYYSNDIMSAYRIGVEGSWANMLASDKDNKKKSIAVKKNINRMLKQFNMFSNEKYCDAVNKKILENEFEILKIEKNLRQMKNSKYKVIFDSLSFKEKFKIYVRCFSPKIVNKISNIYVDINNLYHHKK